MDKPDKLALVEFNGEFYRFVTMSQGIMAFADPDAERQILKADSDDESLGFSLRRSLAGSKKVSLEDFQRIIKAGKVQQAEKLSAALVMQEFGYKTKKAMLQQMKTCTVSSVGSVIEIQPTHRDSLDFYTVKKNEGPFPIEVRSDGSDGYLGSALREAFLRCTSDIG